MQRVLWIGVIGLVGNLSLSEITTAQVVPDGTLGAESSRVVRDRFPGRDGIVRDNDVIEGGARRGSNLFHSFEQFDVPEGQGAYFDQPTDVQNIFSRVTGADRSEILGTLGAFGDANLFFMNPNGIVFGPNSSLDVGGSFVGTTANAIGFGDSGFFSATTPELPSPLLTVSPSAFFFSQVGNGNIINQTRARFGLRVPDGQNLMLLGDIINDGSLLSAFGGRINIGAVAGIGTVTLDSDGTLNFPSALARGNVSIING